MSRVLASWFGTGLILRTVRGSDAGSGTVGSLFAFALSLWLHSFGLLAQMAVLALVVVLAVWSVSRLVETEGDAGWIVIDEAAGALLATIGLTILPALIALVVFRTADIFKGVFPGVASAENAEGTMGVVADDLVAGLYGLAAGLISMAIL